MGKERKGKVPNVLVRKEYVCVARSRGTPNTGVHFYQILYEVSGAYLRDAPWGADPPRQPAPHAAFLHLRREERIADFLRRVKTCMQVYVNLKEWHHHEHHHL